MIETKSLRELAVDRSGIITRGWDEKPDQFVTRGWDDPPVDISLDETARMLKRAPAPQRAPSVEDIPSDDGRYAIPPRERSTLGPTLGGIAGGVGGSVAGAFAGSGVPVVGTGIGAFAGSLAGAELGRIAGALYEIERQNMDPEEAEAYLKEHTGIKHIMLDAAGNLLFWGLGKGVGYLAANTELGRALMKRIGVRIARVLPDKVKPGKAVFSQDVIKGPGATTADELEDAAMAAGRQLSGEGTRVPTKGQLTEKFRFTEQRARQVDPSAFEEQKEDLEKQILHFARKAKEKMAGAQSGETPGHTLERVLGQIEDQVKAITSPLYERLSRMRGLDVPTLIDVSGVRDRAETTLSKAGTEFSPTLRLFLERAVAKTDNGYLSPAEAHELQSVWSAMARDAEKAATPDTPARAAMLELAHEMREALARGLDDAAKSGNLDKKFVKRLREAASLYREMNDTVYSMTGTKALRAAENRGPEHVAATIFSEGNTTAIKELDALHKFATELDKTRAPAAAKRALKKRAKALGHEIDVSRPLAEQIDEVRRGVRAEFFETHARTVEQLANLPRMSPKLRRTFEAVFPHKEDRLIIERLSQAAQIAQRGQRAAGAPSGAAAASTSFVSIGAGLIGFQLGGLGAGVSTAVALYFGPKALAHILTTPKYRPVMSKFTALLVKAGQGGGGAPLIKTANTLIEMAREDGFDLTKQEQGPEQ